MDAALADITGVAGVSGAFVCRSNGDILAGCLDGLEPAVLASVGRTIGRTLDGLRTARKKKVAELNLVFESGCLVVKNLGDAYLVIRCAPTINIPLLNLTANLALRRLRLALETNRSGVPAAAPASTPAGSAAPSSSMPSTPDAAPTLVPGLLLIAARHMGDAGRAFLLRHLAEAHLGQDADLDQLAGWLPGFGYALTYSADPTDAQLMLEEMMGYLERESREPRMGTGAGGMPERG